MHLSYVRSEIPKAVWMEFERRFEGNEVVDMHETMAREVAALLDITKEHHSLSVSPPRFSYSSPNLVDPLGSADPAAVLPSLQQEIRLYEDLSESLRAVIMSSKEEAGRMAERLWPKGRRRQREETVCTMLRKYEGSRKVEYRSDFEGREKVEIELERRWREAKKREESKRSSGIV